MPVEMIAPKVGTTVVSSTLLSPPMSATRTWTPRRGFEMLSLCGSNTPLGVRCSSCVVALFISIDLCFVVKDECVEVTEYNLVRQ